MPLRCAVRGEAPDRRPSRPGARPPAPRTTAAASPVRAAGAPGRRSRFECWVPERTETDPVPVLVVEPEASGEPGVAAGHTTVDAVSSVRAGPCLKSCTGG